MLEAKFKVGQKVYAVSNINDSRQKHVECEVCNSTGKIKVEGRDEEYECPVCHGRMETEHYGYKYVIAYYGATIGKVSIEEYAKKYSRNNKSRVTYMLAETGVGSGTVWREERLFGTVEEAEEFCEKYISSDYYDQEAILREEYETDVSDCIVNCSTCKNNVEFPPPHTCDICTSLDQEEEYGMWEAKEQ